jgi:Protein of unknown function (DUF3429)
MTQSNKTIAWCLSVGGLIPFAACAAVGLFMPDYKQLAFSAHIQYGVVILSFLGAIHWGAALKADRFASAALIWGVIPSLWAWVTFTFDATMQPLWLVGGLLTALAVDAIAFRRYGFPRWMMPIRLVATFGACASLIATYFMLQA